jgi:hypothetical protein
MAAIFFSIGKHISHQAQLKMAELDSSMRPLNIHLTEVLRSQGVNSVFCLPAAAWKRIASESERLLVFTRIHDESRAELWGVRLRLAACVDQGIAKDWVKKAYLWHRMLDIAGGETEIGYKVAIGPTEGGFKLAAVGQIPYNIFDGQEVLLCAVGPKAQQALEEAVIVEQGFDPRHWDNEGYYLGPAL